MSLMGEGPIFKTRQI